MLCFTHSSSVQLLSPSHLKAQSISTFDPLECCITLQLLRIHYTTVKDLASLQGLCTASLPRLEDPHRATTILRDTNSRQHKRMEQRRISNLSARPSEAAGPATAAPSALAVPDLRESEACIWGSWTALFAAPPALLLRCDRDTVLLSKSLPGSHLSIAAPKRSSGGASTVGGASCTLCSCHTNRTH